MQIHPRWAGPCEPLHGLTGCGAPQLMNGLGRLVQQRPSVKKETSGVGAGCGSLINIDLAPREAARGRAGPGHPRRGLIKSGSTAQPGRQGAAGSGVFLSKSLPQPPGLAGACFPAGQNWPIKFIAVQGAAWVLSNPLPPPAPGCRQQGTQACPRLLSPGCLGESHKSSAS